MRFLAFTILISIAQSALIAIAQPATSAGEEVDFERDIRPLFQRHCIECHGPEKAEAGIRLDAKPFVDALGDSVWVPREPQSSPLYLRITSQDADERMPPVPHEPLAAHSIETVRAWIAGGAVWPESDVDRAARDTRLDHWAWQPLSLPDVPVVATDEDRGMGNPIDAFLSAKRAEYGLHSSPVAPRRELIRRLSIDLLGVPPSFEDVEDFVADISPDAYESLVDRYLASPDYGERWAQTWLDIAHYADTHGFERDQKREHAWRYRDYVIRSFANDKPYDQFLLEQVAGDVLWPDQADAVIATGFLSAGPWDFVGQAETPSPQIKRQARADDLDDMLTQVLTATCGITINCARCHNHKLDPISQREYYQMWALLTGSTRGDREADPVQAASIRQRRASLEGEKQEAIAEILGLTSVGLSLADIVGGGNGRGSGVAGQGLHLETGRAQPTLLGFLEGAAVNRFVRSESTWIDGIVIPSGPTTISSIGTIADLPATSGQAWDAIRNGPVNSQKSTSIGSVNFASPGHSVLGLHANAAITFRLSAFRESLGHERLQVQGEIGYGGHPEEGSTSADVRILIDGKTALNIDGVHPNSGKIAFSIPLPIEAQFLTLVSTEGHDGIGHDQVFFGDARVTPTSHAQSDEEKQTLDRWQAKLAAIEQAINALPPPDKVYAIQSGPTNSVFVLARGNTEQPTEAVEPGFLKCIPATQSAQLGNAASDGDRRAAFAKWIVAKDNPLPARVLVNRVWQHHFGTGLVDTPSDFGLGGSLPSHPELLDWLASEFVRNGHSIKALHRLICTSHAYRQRSRNTDSNAVGLDAQNRLLWRQNARRIEAEVLRDCVLQVAGTLNRSKHGPGFQDFDYQEEYAPIYRYQVADRPELWKRSIYRFVVRTTPHPFLTPLDCPDPANLTPKRNITTTAVQSLALWNNAFMLRQSQRMAERITRETSSLEGQIVAAFELALSRRPSDDELNRIASRFHESSDEHVEAIAELCRVLINSNEFVFID